ncbi:hypothetical protein C8R47DRAFT_1143622 [Mycena vitilis]|nr:hypothetical protein C8R47DRAFT_1143622 [Mycena vitilis]
MRAGVRGAFCFAQLFPLLFGRLVLDAWLEDGILPSVCWCTLLSACRAYTVSRMIAAPLMARLVLMTAPVCFLPLPLLPIPKKEISEARRKTFSFVEFSCEGLRSHRLAPLLGCSLARVVGCASRRRLSFSHLTDHFSFRIFGFSFSCQNTDAPSARHVFRDCPGVAAA